MKLIKCYECGNKNSPRAAACPQCGAPNRPPKQSDGTHAKKPKKGGLTGIELFLIFAFLFIIGSIALPAYNDYRDTAERMAAGRPGSAVAESDPDDGAARAPSIPTGSRSTPSPTRPASNPTPASTSSRSSVTASGGIQTQSCAGKPTSSADKSHRYWEIQCLSETQNGNSNPPFAVVSHAPVACAYLDFEARKKFGQNGAWEQIRATEGKRHEAGLKELQKREWAKKGRTFKRVQCTNRLKLTQGQADDSFEFIKKQNHAPPRTLVEVLDYRY